MRESFSLKAESFLFFGFGIRERKPKNQKDFRNELPQKRCTGTVRAVQKAAFFHSVACKQKIIRRTVVMNWYNSLTTPEKIYFYIAIVGSVLLVVQIILMLCSFGGGADADGDADFGGDGEFDSPDGGLGISLFTLKGITSFLAIGGWVGLLVLQINQKNIALSIILALVCGMVSMVLVALAMKGISKLQSDGTVDKEKLIGKEATVYVSIAPNRTGRGKITLTAQGAYTELDAVTDEETRIGVDERVVVVSAGVDYMVVKRASADESEN